MNSRFSVPATHKKGLLGIPELGDSDILLIRLSANEGYTYTESLCLRYTAPGFIWNRGVSMEAFRNIKSKANDCEIFVARGRLRAPSFYFLFLTPHSAPRLS